MTRRELQKLIKQMTPRELTMLDAALSTTLAAMNSYAAIPMPASAWRRTKHLGKKLEKLNKRLAVMNVRKAQRREEEIDAVRRRCSSSGCCVAED